MYRYLANRTGKKFNSIVLKRLFMSRQHRAPISIARIARFLKRKGNDNKIVVTCSTVTDDVRLLEVPKFTVSVWLFMIIFRGIGIYEHEQFRLKSENKQLA